MFSPEPKASRALPRLVSELAAELGSAAVGTLALVDTWTPYARTHLAPFGSMPDAPAARPPTTTSALEPTRLVAPVRVAADAVRSSTYRLLGRVEAIAWWREPVERCDYVAVWMGAREGGALAWVACESSALARGEAIVRGWID